MAILLRILTTAWITRLLLPLAIAAGLFFGFWGSLLSFFGVGIALPILVTGSVIWLIWRRQLPPLRKWNLGLGAISFSAALLGILAFFTPGDGILNEVSLGGNLGKDIKTIGGSTSIGVLSIIGFTILGTAFIGPRFTWELLKKGIRGIGPASRKLKEWTQISMNWLHDFYVEHPIHTIIINWVKERRSPEKVERIPMPPEPPARIEPLSAETGPVPDVKAASAKAPPGAPLEVTHEAVKMQTTPPAPVSRGGWHLPSIDLLDEVIKTEMDQAEVERRARIIEESLASYGVEAKVVQTNIGPAVTQFGVEPGWDRKFKEKKEKDKDGNIQVRREEVSKTRVKVERISSLANDLALALSAPSIRIEAPIPGKPMVGVEVPNSSMGSVALREIMESNSFEKVSAKSKLVLALGKGTSNEMVAGDLARMPHLLIAGATGAGKTVCLDTIIASLLMNNTPDEMQFIMIDPKRVELIAFNGVPHLRTPVITETENTVEILKWCTQEMDSRFRKLAQIRGAHDIATYNKSIKVGSPMPYLIVIIDELADLMMAKADEVEPRLCRLAQMGRAVGIHLVVATQRPSVDVVTGLIKANFPTRISFAVASQVDSRTILDTVGAERLLGRGDMLFQPQDAPKPKRLQGCFTSSKEIERLVDFWVAQAKAQVVRALEQPYEESTTGDPLLEEAKRLAKQHKQISASFLQRQMRIGYSRAERLIQQLEQEDQGEDDENQLQ